MLDFHKYLMRHGESSVQAIIENAEHAVGIRGDVTTPLETRWNIVMGNEQDQTTRLAA